MNPKPFRTLRLLLASLLCFSLLTSPVDASAGQAEDVAAILALLQDVAPSGDAFFTFPYDELTFESLSEIIAYYTAMDSDNHGNLAWSPIQTMGQIGFRLDDILALLALVPTNSISAEDLESALYTIQLELSSSRTSIEDILAHQSSIDSILLGPVDYDLPHMHSDVEQILDVLQNDSSKYQHDVTNALNDILSDVGSLADSLVDGFLGSSASSGQLPSLPSDPSDPSPPSYVDEGVTTAQLDMDLDHEQVRVDYFPSTFQIDQSRYFDLWSGVRFGNANIPAACVDLAESHISSAGQRMAAICDTIYWLMYYLAIFFLVRREFTYYASLGHTQESAN